jgi:hypothetical protein
VVEEAGIPTLCMTSALDITQAVKPPRAVFLNFPLGHQTGRPNDRELQRAIVRDALRAFETIRTPGGIVKLPYVWDPNDSAWEHFDYTKEWSKNLPPRPPREAADKMEANRKARFAKPQP